MSEITDGERQAIQARLGHSRKTRLKGSKRRLRTSCLNQINDLRQDVLSLLFDREEKVRKIKALRQWCPDCHGAREITKSVPGERDGRGWIRYRPETRPCETCESFYEEEEEDD